MERLSDHAYFLAAQGPHTPGTTCGTILTTSTGGQSLDIGGATNPVSQMQEVWESGNNMVPQEPAL